jgi:CoA:oxalate CoA-transferase
MEKILDGIRVLDFTDALAGPFCTRYMADCGAEVFTIEKPGGKATRNIPYFFKGQGVQYLYNHCGKKSIGIDLKKPAAKELVFSLAKKCDVIVENFRPGTMQELGLEYSAFEAVNPSIVMCSISGWGQSGPYYDRMGADLSIQATSGILDLTGESDRRPVLVGFPVTDFLAGLNAFGAICAALVRRERTGKGNYIDIAMADCATACLHEAFGIHTLTEGREEMRRAGGFNGYMPSWGVFKGKDGYIAISAATKVGWDRLTDLMGKPELADDPRFNTREERVRNHNEVVRIVEEWLENFEKVRDVATLLQTYRIQAAPVQTVAQVIDEDPQFKSRDMVREIEHPLLGKTKFLNTPLKFKYASAFIDGPPPVIPGQDTHEALKHLLDMQDGEMETLKKENVIFDGK